MSTVKNNEQTAATDQQKIDTAKRIAAINIVSSMVAKRNLDIDTIPTLIRRVDGLFDAGMYENTLKLTAPATQTAIPAPAQPVASVQPAPVAEVAAPVKKARRTSAKQATKAAAATETVAEAPVEAPVAEVAKKRGRKAKAKEAPRPRGRPRKQEEKLVMGQFAVPYNNELSEEENDRLFLEKYPPIMSVEESMQPVGEKDQMRLIFSQKPVSFIKTHLARYYGRSFEDYKRIYDLPADYPEKPANYVKKMQGIAAKAGLGTTLPKVKTVEADQAVEAKAEAPKAKRTPKATPQRKVEAETVAEVQAEAAATPAKGGRPRKTRNIEAQAA